MLLLASVSDSLSLVTTGAVGTGLDVHASYIDTNGNVVTFGRSNTPRITSAATTPLVPSLADSTQRSIKFLSVSNVNVSASVQITLQLSDGITTSTLIQYVLLAGETLQYRDDSGWVVLDVSGGIKTLSSGANAPANDLYMYVAGTLMTASQKIWEALPVRTVLLPAGLPGSLVSCDVAPTGAVSLVMRKNTSAIGTVNIGAGATVGSFTFASDQTLNGTGDVTSIEAPAIPDATLAGVRVTLRATRSN